MGRDVGELLEFVIRALQVLGIGGDGGFRLLSRADVDDDAEDEQAFRRMDRGEPDLDREFAAVLAQAGEIAPGAHRSRARVGDESGAMPGMPGLEAGWNQFVDRLADEFLAR